MAEEKDKTTAKEPEALKETKAKGPVLCGHQNKHFIPATKDGQPVQGDKLTCTLERGHGPVRVERRGPKNEDISTYEVVHSAPYKTVANGVIVDALASWSDAAGE
jgi:hypothetical protein